MGHRIKLTDWDEYDAVCGKGSLLVFSNNTGLRKKIKRKINKRYRRLIKKELREYGNLSA